MSGCTMTSEMYDLAETFGYGWDTLRWFTVNAMKSAFIGFDERLALIEDVIKPGYDALSASAPQPGLEPGDELAPGLRLLGERRAGCHPGRVRPHDERDEPAEAAGLGEGLGGLGVPGPLTDVGQQLRGQVELDRVEVEHAVGEVLPDPGEHVGVHVLDAAVELADRGRVEHLGEGDGRGQVGPGDGGCSRSASARNSARSESNTSIRPSEPRKTGLSSR